MHSAAKSETKPAPALGVLDETPEIQASPLDDKEKDESNKALVFSNSHESAEIEGDEGLPMEIVSEQKEPASISEEADVAEIRYKRASLCAAVFAVASMSMFLYRRYGSKEACEDR